MTNYKKNKLIQKHSALFVPYIKKDGEVLVYLQKRSKDAKRLPNFFGYWDGLGRKLSNKGHVLIQGKKCKIMGRVCMNHIMVDVSCFENIKTGEKVTILGKDKNKEITADELTKQIGTINYGIITRINPLIPRILK